MKGFATVVLGLIMLAIISFVMFLSFGIVFSGEGGLNAKVKIQRDLYVMDNALQGAQLYMETALRYSTYQALHDLENPGRADLENKILENLKSYTQAYTFLSSNYQVQVPEYDSVAVTVSEGALAVEAAAGTMKIKREEPAQSISLERSSSSKTFIRAYPERKYPVSTEKGIEFVDLNPAINKLAGVL